MSACWCIAFVLSRARLFATPWAVACLTALSMGFFQVRILEWVAISYSSRSSQSRDGTRNSHVSCIGRRILHL